MKIRLMIFILLICVLPVRAQEEREPLPDQFTTKKRVFAYNSAIHIFEEGKSNSLYKDEYVLRVLLGLYEEYEKECWNDSTEQCFNYYEFGGGLYADFKTPCSEYDYDLGINAGYKGTHKEWIHREPTFQDFMAYLKRKIKH